ncbi:MAG: addiction module toxin RelE [Alphaproteobacteria bacterium]|nr:MAG: addiction module toxin RelE [Alphaproteobacteria bacterium]
MKRKRLGWIRSSYKDFIAFPEDVQDVMGFSLDMVQCGKKPLNAKPLKGFGSGVLELMDDHRGKTYRAVYTVRFEDVVYVLHAFQKKSKKGIATPKQDIDLIKQRLKNAQELYSAIVKK